jgi:hypothetical protein
MADELDLEICDTTMTPRVPSYWCVCMERTDLMGPCLTWNLGQNGRCVYCDHDFYCHRMLMAARGKMLNG